MCGQSTLTCPHPSKVLILIGSNALQDLLHRSISSNAFQDHLRSSILCKLTQDHHCQNHSFPGLQREISVLQDHQCLQDHHFPATYISCPSIFHDLQVSTKVLLCSQVKKTFFFTCSPWSLSPIFVPIRKPRCLKNLVKH